MKIKKLLFDADVLANANEKNSNRSGIYNVAYAVAYNLLQSSVIELYFMVSTPKQKQLIQNNLKEFSRVKFFVKHERLAGNTLNVLFDLKVKYKHNNILASLLHVFSFIFKCLMFLPDKTWNFLRKYLTRKFNNIDIIFSPQVCFTADILKIFSKSKKYVFLHDCIPLLYPEYFPNVLNGKSWNVQLINYMKTQGKNEVYFSNSQQTKQDFLTLCSSLQDKQIIVAPLACNESFKHYHQNFTIQALKKYKLPIDKKYVLSLCSLEPRKNLIRAIKTFIEFIKKNHIDDMVFILGGGHWDSFIDTLKSEIVDLGKYKNKIIRAGYIDDEDLGPLYSGAEWFVYTSQYEGFGLPPLEAMTCGCPVITSNNSSLPEVVGTAGIMIDWNSDEQHVLAYEKYYFDKTFRNQMSEAGMKRAQQFSWKNCVDIMIKEFYNNDK